MATALNVPNRLISIPAIANVYVALCK